ncbi:MAG: FprA family A-type flavoprotein [Oscillospiraceae bacterium]
MYSKQITKDVYSVGVLNPNMRVFDIIMKTDFGTSYNSYIVKGSEKTALIDASHLTFTQSFVENIKSVIELEKIDYLIMNHNEPDHSGAIAKLLEIAPHIKIVTSQAGAIYLKNIINKDIAITVVKDGDTLELGNKQLKFINAPFLHWPDSVFTYSQSDKVLFSCDFFGSHYCEPEVIDTKITYKENYFTALKGYYDAIFGPFGKYVQNGLKKIQDLDISYVATSHGPILSKDGVLDEVVKKYSEWSSEKLHDEKIIPLFFCSAYGNTRLIAKNIAQGIKNVFPTAIVETYDIIKHDMAQMSALLNDSDAFLLGSPTLNKDAVAPVWQLLSGVDAINIAKRPAAIFGSYGWSGEAFQSLTKRLESLKVNLVQEPFKVCFVPTPDDLKNAQLFGETFAKALK